MRRLGRVDADSPVRVQRADSVLNPLDRDRLSSLWVRRVLGAHEHVVAAHGNDRVRLAGDRRDCLPDEAFEARPRVHRYRRSHARERNATATRSQVAVELGAALELE